MADARPTIICFTDLLPVRSNIKMHVGRLNVGTKFRERGKPFESEAPDSFVKSDCVPLRISNVRCTFYSEGRGGKNGSLQFIRRKA